MATLPNIPANSAVTVGVIAGLAVVTYSIKLRAQLDSQIHENYRHAKLIDAGMQPETTPLTLAKRSDNRTA
jgi:hypothetical protein